MVAIVIVNYRTPGLAADCLRSLELELKDLPGARVWLVDGGSGDGSAEALAVVIRERGYEWVTLLPLARNDGFAFANNAALARLLPQPEAPRYVMLLNPDTVVLPGALRALVDFLDSHPEYALAGSRCLNADGSVRRTAFRFPTLLGELEGSAQLGPLSRLLARWVVAPAVREEPHGCDWLSGAAVCIRREVFDAVGGLDDGFFLYYEETDFARRAARAGFRSAYVPASRIVHYCGQSTGVTQPDGSLHAPPQYFHDSRRRYFTKHHGAIYARAVEGARITGRAIQRLRRSGS